jgi:3-methyladenine DNA glycosylase AlkC
MRERGNLLVKDGLQNSLNDMMSSHPSIPASMINDYQRAKCKCEDPRIISHCFDLVKNIYHSKYGIIEQDTYNFDETDFQMGMAYSKGHYCILP